MGGGGGAMSRGEDGGVEDSHGSVRSNAVGESWPGQSPKTDELNLGRRDVVDRNQW